MFPLSSPWTHVGKLQQKSSLYKMRRTTWTPETAPKLQKFHPLANCKGNHPANYSQCPTLLTYLAKRTLIPTRYKQLSNRHVPYLNHNNFLPSLKSIISPHFLSYSTDTRTQTCINIRTSSYNKNIANWLHSHLNKNPDITTRIDQIKSTDLDLFLQIITLIQKYYVNCNNNLDRVKATIQIVKELENRQP